jgi:hypothetical protein
MKLTKALIILDIIGFLIILHLNTNNGLWNRIIDMALR